MTPSNFLLGYWLEMTGVSLPARPSIEYRGLDRDTLIPLPGPHEDEEWIAAGRSALLKIRDRYWDAEETFELNIDRDTALRLRDDFEAKGISLEVIFAEVLFVPTLPPEDQDLSEHMRQAFEYRNIAHERLIHSEYQKGLEPLGVDVVYPNPSFHSAIYQPNLAEVMPDFVDSLNSAGLFPDLESAEPAIRLANEMDTSWRPFCPVMISLVPERR